MPGLTRFAAALTAALLVPAALSAAPIPALTQDYTSAGPAVIKAQAGGLKAMMRQIFYLIDQGQDQQASALLDEAIALNTARRGRDGPGVQFVLRKMQATLLTRAGSFDAAETELKQLLVEFENASWRKSADISAILSDLGWLYLKQGRWAEAGPLFARSLELAEKNAGKSNPATAEMINNLGIFYVQTGQADQAIPLFQRALAIYQKYGSKGDFGAAAILLNLGDAYQTLGDYTNALRCFDISYRINLKLFGADNASTIQKLSNIAVLQGILGKFDEAAPLSAQVLAYTKAHTGAKSPALAQALNTDGWNAIGQKNYDKAIGQLRAALAIYFDNRTLQKQGPNARGVGVDEREVSRAIRGFLRAAAAISEADPKQASALLDEAFQIAQQVHRSKADAALLLTSARFAAGSGPLAALIRSVQDNAARRQEVEAWLNQSIALPAARRDIQKEALARNVIAEAQQTIAALSADIIKKFPDYAALADPKPVSVAQAQSMLGPNDALTLIAPFGDVNGEALFTFVITKTEAHWSSSDIGLTRLSVMVQILRCGLDIGAWQSGLQGACARLAGPRAIKPGDDLPFDAATAAELYTAVFGGLAPLIGKKTLWLVAPDPLASLPFQVLLKSPPARDKAGATDFARLDWLGRSNAIAVLPSVAALRGLQGSRATASAPLPFIGYGNPVLTGSLDCQSPDVALACPSRGTGASAALASRGSPRIDAVKRNNRGQADPDAVRTLCPLPETALELKCVAESLKSPASSVRTGAQATVSAVRAENLGQYRIVEFATHGLLAGDLQTPGSGAGEPALVLTPPSTPQPADDGLLRASDIAALRLNADWVVLSACNTASGASLGGEALSGLASAFFYAGARALLVSHWPVRSDAAVLLTTRAFSEMAAEPQLGRAEAMRRSMTALMDDPSGIYAHPSVWAPFAVVGDGGRASP